MDMFDKIPRELHFLKCTKRNSKIPKAKKKQKFE